MLRVPGASTDQLVAVDASYLGGSGRLAHMLRCAEPAWELVVKGQVRAGTRFGAEEGDGKCMHEGVRCSQLSCACCWRAICTRISLRATSSFASLAQSLYPAYCISIGQAVARGAVL